MAERPLRVVRIIARMNIGGPARHVALLQRHLPARGYASTLVTGLPGDGEEEMPPEVAAGAPIERVIVPELGRALRAGDDLIAFTRILSVLRHVQPDIVHTHTAKAGALGRGAALAYNATRRPGRRAVIVHTFHGHVFHGYFSPAMSRLVRTTERNLARASDRIIAISDAQRRDLVERFRIAPAAKVEVVPLGLDLDALRALPARASPLRQAAGFPDDAIVCGYIGRLVPIKHVDLLLRAFARAAANEPRARLLIVGGGELRVTLERLAEDLSLGSRVHFAGWQTALAEVYRAMDIVALASRNEGTPVALIEAAAARRAIVSTDVGGVADVVQADRTGLLVPDDDEDAMTEALSRLLTDAPLRARLGEAAHQQSLGRFESARLVADLDGVYRRARHARGLDGSGRP
jgi:glycosyltransferase involved in cell wall biosynthesis